METSFVIARMLGPFYIAVGLGILLNRDYFRRVVTGIEESPALFYISGALAYLVGALIVTVHNYWAGWPIVITLLGWAAVLKGTIRIVAPAYSQALVTRVMSSPNSMIASGIVTLVLGAYLTAMGFSASS